LVTVLTGADGLVLDETRVPTPRDDPDAARLADLVADLAMRALDRGALDAIGLDNVTPEAFSEAIEEGDDVPPAALNDTLKLFTNKTVKVLAYNDQTSSPETEQVKKAAEDNGIPVVGVTV
ncbi:hypothetical protein IAE22_32515, partial [Bacillus sp. S34]|nr:hypothetical protein [Bacillus sp. S34]